MDYLKEYHKWCTEEVFDKETKKELEAIKNNEDEIKDRFYKELEFGTAGLRGIIGAGTNRMNQYTVGKATQGLANFIKKEKGEERGVVISYDSRKMSPEFSKETALILNANGIKTYLFDSLRPVPELSFAVRELKCIAGIMITASHNPPKYNGYKVYWEDGAQIVSPKDKQIIEEVRKVTDYKEIKKISEEQATAEGLFHIIGEEIDEKYQEVLRKLVLNPEIVKKQGKELKIVYTPLHGTGNIPVRTILKSLGFENVMVVPEQELPDGNFPTVSYPNPEDPKAFTLALKLAKKENADVILATDPDADRLGVYAKDSKTGEYRSFTGNMSGLLIAEYELSQRKEQNKLPQNGVLIKTIVSSNLADAIVAVMALCEAAAYYKEQGLTLWDQMIKIYEKYGFYKEGLLSITLEGADGAQKIKEMLENMRSHPITKIGDSKVTKFRDYEKGIIKDIETGKEEETTLPKSNVLYYDLEEDAWCCVRPSGTEPKIKLYMGVKADSMESAEKDLEELKDAMVRLVK